MHNLICINRSVCDNSERGLLIRRMVFTDFFEDVIGRENCYTALSSGGLDTVKITVSDEDLDALSELIVEIYGKRYPEGVQGLLTVGCIIADK